MEINYREFIRNFAKYRDGVERVAVMGKDGLVGVWLPVSICGGNGGVYEGLPKSSAVLARTVNEDGQTKAEILPSTFFQNAAAEKFANIIKPKEEKQQYCKKCGGVGAGTHKYWDEIELEDVEAVFCLRCAKMNKVNLKPL